MALIHGEAGTSDLRNVAASVVDRLDSAQTSKPDRGEPKKLRIRFRADEVPMWVWVASAVMIAIPIVLRIFGTKLPPLAVNVFWMGAVILPALFALIRASGFYTPQAHPPYVTDARRGRQAEVEAACKRFVDEGREPEFALEPSERKALELIPVKRVTSAALEKLPKSYSVTNGVTEGSETIDHLVKTPKGSLAVFTVDWSGQFPITQHNDGVVIPLESDYFSEIEGFFRIAQRSTLEPRAIIVAVAGSVGTAIANETEAGYVFCKYRAQKTAQGTVAIDAEPPVLLVNQKDVRKGISLVIGTNSR